MAESTLTLTNAEFASVVGGYLGYGRQSTGWSENQAGQIDDAVQAGLRQFYRPPAPFADHAWSFLKPTAAIDVWATATGTVKQLWRQHALLPTPVNLQTYNAIFVEQMLGYDLTLTMADGSYSEAFAITEYTQGDTVVLEGTPNVLFRVDDGVEVTGCDYNLPDDFGGIDGDLNFGAGENYWTLPVVDESQLRTLRQQHADTAGRPQRAAIGPKSTSSASGQRFVLMLWPRPAATHTLYYRYNVLVDAITTSAAYPLGGMTHSETIRASCLAAAERKMSGAPGAKMEAFMDRLAASVEMDKTANAAEFLGD